MIWLDESSSTFFSQTVRAAGMDIELDVFDFLPNLKQEQVQIHTVRVSWLLTMKKEVWLRSRPLKTMTKLLALPLGMVSRMTNKQKWFEMIAFLFLYWQVSVIIEFQLPEN